MALSSSSLIHFTKTKESLNGILEDNFKIFYCFEKVILGNFPLEFAVPMVSFCDIPLSEIKSHISKYGSYGIGLTKEWAERQKLNPVLYVEKNSQLSDSYKTVYKEYLLDQGKGIDNSDVKEKSIVDILRYIKNYQGDLKRNGELFKDYRFSDEREWRHVIDFREDITFILNKHNYSSVEIKDKANQGIEKFRLEFSPNDIKYIIIKDETEISDFIKVLKKSKGKIYSYDDVERLITRLITTEQIFNDF